MVSSDIGAFQLVDVVGYLAVGAEWTRTVYQNGRINPYHGFMRKRYRTSYILIFCRSLQSTRRILGAVTLLCLSGLLCLLRISC